MKIIEDINQYSLALYENIDNVILLAFIDH